MIEGNAIELTTVDVNPIPGVTDRYALGVILYDNGSSLTPFGGVVIRNNHIQYFENRSPAGTLIQGFREDNGSLYTELATDADDAFIISLLRHRT